MTALLVLLTGLSTGVRETMIDTATTLSTGHVNVGGFYKVTAGQAAPVVTDYKKVLEIARKAVPEMAYAVQRGRGWAKVVSDTGSMQLGITGIDIKSEPKVAQVLQLVSGNLERSGAAGHHAALRQPGREAGRQGGRRHHHLGADHARHQQHHRRAGGGHRAQPGPAQHLERLHPDRHACGRSTSSIRTSTGVIQIMLKRKDVDHIPAIAARLRLRRSSRPATG